VKLCGSEFETVDWAGIEPTEYPGERGVALWRTKTFGDIRIRIVEYSPDYVADHWCDKGHILLVVSGELTTELLDGRRYELKAGMGYQVSDLGDSPHRSVTSAGAKLFIID
jgi:hypothetical protein